MPLIAQTVPRNRKNVEKCPELSNVRFFHFLRIKQTSIVLRACQNESGVCDVLLPVTWTVQMLRGTPEYGLIPNLFPQYMHSHNIFSENRGKVVLTLRRDVESSETKHNRRRRIRKCLPPENGSNGSRPVRLERVYRDQK